MTDELMFRVRVPGKAMVAGEYAVLTGAPGIVCAVGRHLTCDVYSTSAPALEIIGAGQQWRDGTPESPGLRFAISALRIARDWARAMGRSLPAVRFELTDALRAPDGSKLGLGGSACTTVAVCAAALAAAGVEPEKELLCRLAAIAHAEAQGTVGSGLDIAASTFGGVLWTRRLEVSAALAAWRAAGPAALPMALDRMAEPERERLPGFPILLAFSGRSAATGPLVERVRRFASSSPREFAEFVARTSAACARLRQASQSGDLDAAARAVEDAGGHLDRLGQGVGEGIVTDEHRRIATLAREAGAAAKISGAGGGDCSIAVGTEAALDVLEARLRGEGLHVVRPGVDEDGVVVERSPATPASA